MEMLVLTAAVAVISAAVYFFLIPSHASVSSISGLAIVLSNFVPLSISAITMILNVILLVIGFFTCGKTFGVKTVYTSILLPVFLGIFERVLPDNQSMTGSAELDVVCYIFVVSIGLSILFNRNASSGGLDIVAKIMNKYLHMELGKAMSLSGMCVALSSALIYDKKTVILSILGTYLNGMILDHFIFGQNVKRRVCIITKKEEQLRDFIINTLHSGATVYEAIGAYNLEKHNEIITIVNKSEYQKLMNYINHEDPEAFITVYTVTDMRYFNENKKAWEEAFEHKLPGWGEENYERLMNEHLPFLGPDLAKELEAMDFKGKTAAQFCCNNGRELLSLMQLGAKEGYGFDIAENIIGQARDTAQKAGIDNCRFTACNILEIPEEYNNRFDFVMFTIGAITWFEDLEQLFSKVADCLRPGGILLIHDYHPLMNMLAMPGEPAFDEKHLNQIAYSYFRKEPWIENEGMGYMSEQYVSKTFTSFSHTMSDIINAVCFSKMNVCKLNEYDYDIGLTEAYDKKGFPLSFLLIAQK